MSTPSAPFLNALMIMKFGISLPTMISPRLWAATTCLYICSARSTEASSSCSLSAPLGMPTALGSRRPRSQRSRKCVSYACGVGTTPCWRLEISQSLAACTMWPEKKLMFCSAASWAMMNSDM